MFVCTLLCFIHCKFPMNLLAICKKNKGGSFKNKPLETGCYDPSILRIFSHLSIHKNYLRIKMVNNLNLFE